MQLPRGENPAGLQAEQSFYRLDAGVGSPWGRAFWRGAGPGFDDPVSRGAVVSGDRRAIDLGYKA